MASNQDGSDGSHATQGEPLRLTVDQVKALVEGGLFDELLNKSPAIAAMHDRLATMEARTAEMTSGFGQVHEQLKNIAAALGQPPTPPAEEAPPELVGANAAAGSLDRWAPLINALGVKALGLGGGEATPTQNLGAAFAQVLELFKHFTAFQVEVNKANAIAYKTMQQVLRETPEPASAAAEVGG